MGNDIIQHRVAIGLFNCSHYCFKSLHKSLKSTSVFAWLIFEISEAASLLSIYYKASVLFTCLCILQCNVPSVNATIILLLLLELSGDVELNPGPQNFKNTNECHSLSIFHLNLEVIKQNYSKEFSINVK